MFFFSLSVRRHCCGNFVDRRFVKHCILLLVLTFLVILPTFCFRLRFSLYSLLWKKNVTQGRKILRQENNERLKFADSFFSTLENKSEYFGSGNVDVGISIITVSRNRHAFDKYEPRYLTQVLSYFLHQIQQNKNLNLRYQLYICNVDEEPSTFYEASKLSKIIPSFNRFTNSSVTTWKTINKTLEKEKQDYVYCGEQTLLQNVSYVFLVEDDALPHKDLLHVLDFLLTEYPDKMNTTFVKFYHPDRLLGYISFELERIPELLGLSLMMGALLVSIYQKFRISNSVHRYVLWTSAVLYFLLVFLSIGRQNLLELRRISKYFYQLTPAPSCCTPANLYPRHGMQQIINYLKSVKCYSKFGKDTAIDSFRKQSKLAASMVQPNLFQHIGMYSSLRNSILNPFIV